MAANLERLKKRIKALEEWTDENETLGGPEGTLDTFNYLISRVRQADQMQAHLNQLQGYLQEYLNETESMDQWNEFIQTREKENNANEKHSPEEVSPRKEAEDGEEVGEEDSEGNEASEESET
jgi:hypothetical protein